VYTSLCIYRVKPGSEKAFRGLLAKHWPTLKGAGLAAEEPSIVYEGSEEKRGGKGPPIFFELLHWKDAEGPNHAHELPAVMAVWEPMGALCEARDGRPAMEFPGVERLEIKFER
jgi:hypothetical protein